MAELADALDLGSSGRPWGFESLHPHAYGVGFSDVKKSQRLFIIYESSLTKEIGKWKKT